MMQKLLIPWANLTGWLAEHGFESRPMSRRYPFTWLYKDGERCGHYRRLWDEAEGQSVAEITLTKQPGF